MKRKRIYFLIILGIIFISSLLAYYSFFTPSGSSLFIKTALNTYLKTKDIAGEFKIKTTEGSLSEKTVLRDITIEDLTGLPKASVLKIQRIEISFVSLSTAGLNLDVFNGRLLLPGSNPILFYGGYHNNSFNINLFSKSISVRDFLDIFMEKKTLRELSGIITELDIYLKGAYSEPQFTGELMIENLLFKNFSAMNCPGRFDITVKDFQSRPRLSGEADFGGGVLQGPKTAAVELQEGRIVFSGELQDSQLDFKGSSIVENLKIKIILQGTLDAPVLKLTSEPPMPQGRLLAMLATGKSWKGAEKGLSNGAISADMAMDFIDYFLFSGSGSKLAQRLGISEVSLTLEEQKKGIGVKKTLSDKMEAEYAVEQSQTKEGLVASTEQKIAGEYKVTGNVSLGAERKIKQDNQTEKEQGPATAEDKVILKYEKEF
ncbi:translocation/assembly module TamB domain-containing protein [Candidatus Omnitrophota bacterium]